MGEKAHISVDCLASDVQVKKKFHQSVNESGTVVLLPWCYVEQLKVNFVSNIVGYL